MMLAGACGFASSGGLMFWCSKKCLDAKEHVSAPLAQAILPDSAFAAPPPVAPTLTITKLAAQTSERLAVLDRVRPILSDAIQQAEGYEAVALVTSLGVRIMQAILRGE